MAIFSAAKLTYDLCFRDNSNNEMSIEEHSEIISRLKFIGKIQEGEKINVKYMYVQPSSMLTRLSRSFIHIDNRRNAFNFIVRTVSRSFDIIFIYLNSEKICDRELAREIIKDVKDSKSGIKCLKKTYKSDLMICCELDTLIQKIDSRLDEIRRKYPDYYPVSPYPSNDKGLYPNDSQKNYDIKREGSSNPIDIPLSPPPRYFSVPHEIPQTAQIPFHNSSSCDSEEKK